MPQLQLEVCDALDVDGDGEERGVRSGGSFICRGRRGAATEGAMRLASSSGCRFSRGDGSDGMAASRCILGSFVALRDGRPVCANCQAHGEMRDQEHIATTKCVTRLMHLRQRTTYSATICAGRSRIGYGDEKAFSMLSVPRFCYLYVSLRSENTKQYFTSPCPGPCPTNNGSKIGD